MPDGRRKAAPLRGRDTQTGRNRELNTLKTFFLMMVLSTMLLLIGGLIGGQAGIINRSDAGPSNEFWGLLV